MMRRACLLSLLVLPSSSVLAFLPTSPGSGASLAFTKSYQEQAHKGWGAAGKPAGRIFPPAVGAGNSEGDFFSGISSFFENLLNPTAASKAAAATATPAPKRRSGGPVALVFGATGKAGREVVDTLLGEGFDVVAAVRNASKAGELFGDRLKEEAGGGRGLLDLKSGVDVTKSNTLGAGLFEDVDHVVLALGPVGGPQPGGGFGFYPGLTSEDVDYKGVVKVLEAFEKHRNQSVASADVKPMFRFESANDLEKWERLDDVIMGGKSSSAFELGTGFAEYKGELVVEDGGFCGTRASKVDLDLAGYDGIRLRVMGDGNRYKLNLKTVDSTSTNESVYQVAFDTVSGAWASVDLPFDLFLPVVRNRVNYKAPRLSSRSGPVVASVGIVYSRFEFNRQPNPYYKEGPFSLKISEISAYRQPRPAVVLISSAGAERNAKVETDEERRAEIPIVQLNPGGILNWKYKAEAAVRASSLPYVIFRACGLVPERAFNKSAMLQGSQGDVITGRLTRADLAQAIAASLVSPYSAYKTLEIRRDENDDAVNKATNFDRLYKGLVRDTERVTSGILPFPEPVDPPGDVSPERRSEILNDPRVQATITRDRAVEQQGQKEGAGEEEERTETTPATAGVA